jgi:hypothetical protein
VRSCSVVALRWSMCRSAPQLRLQRARAEVGHGRRLRSLPKLRVEPEASRRGARLVRARVRVRARIRVRVRVRVLTLTLTPYPKHASASRKSGALRSISSLETGASYGGGEGGGGGDGCS